MVRYGSVMNVAGLKEWLKANELKINIVMLVLSLLVLTIGILANSGAAAGVGLLAVIFFAIYSIYGYVHVNGLGPE